MRSEETRAERETSGMLFKQIINKVCELILN